MNESKFMKRTIIELSTGTVFTGGAVAAQVAHREGVFSLNDYVDVFGFLITGTDLLTLISFSIGFFSFLLVVINQIRKMK